MGIGQIQEMGTNQSLNLHDLKAGTIVEFKTANSTYRLRLTDPGKRVGYLLKIGEEEGRRIQNFGSKMETGSAMRVGWIFVGQYFVVGSKTTSRIQRITVIKK